MLAITSMLHPRNAQRVNKIITELEAKFGLKAVQATPAPHFTFMLAGVRSIGTLHHSLVEVAATTPPFSAYTTGIGIFPGPKPVIYIPVLRSFDLNHLHQRVLDVTQPLCKGTDRFNAPSRWLPHLSLALHDTTPETLGPVLHFLNESTYNMRLNINNIGIMQKKGSHYKCVEQIELTGRD
ncbi:2'-5' RNA ligase family protein [Hymenobacter sp. PAMC 26628]|uniref:2'-5' RNA ligase family protein n=1 Tax=Hymenobacter sp. PAMC 26628 TaxID=1484118 RepID=UPI000770662F|nr:2'-5' RNA ligase family protein [Hymenobacter sp. PAMC 26628]AMJ66447.1 hypothetical protein AXW84_14180 [Hymenobacter sp. PAMC 26628]